MAGGSERLGVVQPLPLVPSGSIPVSDGVALLEAEGGAGIVFIWGQAAFSFDGDDPAARRLAAVQLVNCDAASQREVAAAFGVNETTIWRWRSEYSDGGLQALCSEQKGPKRASLLTADKVAEIRELRAGGRSFSAVAQAAGVSSRSARRAVLGSTPPEVAKASGETELVPLARPKDRSAERAAAAEGLLAEAAPVITEGASLPLVGALAILPGIAVTGLLEVATDLYGAGRRVRGAVRSSFYGLRALLLTVIFACLTGEPRAEGLSRIDPVAVGRLLGLDRAPEVKRLRFRIAELAGEKKADELQMALARRHVAVHPEACGLLYVDGHVRAYHGKAEVQKAHVARMRIAMPGEVDTFVTDRLGQALLFWQADPGQSLAGELRLTTEKVRELLGPDARPTICFDRGGWSPKLFGELSLCGFDVLTYKKGSATPEPREAFAEAHFVDDAGHDHAYLLSDHPVSLPYDSGRHTFSCRQITRLDEKSGHQTQIITTRTDPDAALLAYAMFSRWREENFFRYTRAHYGLDALDAYATVPDDPGRLVANPARRDAARSVAEARREIAAAQAHEGQGALAGRAVDPEIAAAFSDAGVELNRREEETRALPVKVPLGEVRPDAVRLDVERKRIMDAIRMATYNAESGLARLLAPHYARAEDEARSLLREIYSSPGDLEVDGQTLHVRIAPLSAPRRTRALAALCEELTVTKTLYPGTDLTLAYSVKER